jgi:hypothetical protein
MRRARRGSRFFAGRSSFEFYPERSEGSPVALARL